MKLAEVSLEGALNIGKEYLENLGVANGKINYFFNKELFEDGFIQSLTDAGVINANKSSKTTAKTTHIHITGPSRFIFYTEEELKTAGGLEDDRISVKLLNANIAHLLFLGKQREMIDFHFTDEVQLLSSHTVKKVSSRGQQVQLSKKSLDGQDFIRFRSGLYADDLLVFLKYKDSQEGYLVLGIPAIKIEHIISPLPGRKLSQVEATSIGAYSVNQDRDREISSLVDLSKATSIRLDRSMRHQKLVRIVAKKLNDLGYKIFEGLIDCLATKVNSEVLIFEMKTLDGTASDEMHQVRDALGQLLYYEFLQIGQFESANKLKIACFESGISDKHRELFVRNGCYVIWLDSTGEIRGETEILKLLGLY